MKIFSARIKEALFTNGSTLKFIANCYETTEVNIQLDKEE